MEETTIFEPKILSESQETPIESRRIYWRKLLKSFERSGLTQKQFAEQHGVKPNTFSKWKRNFEKTEKKFSKEKRTNKVKEKVKLAEPIDFLPVELTDKIKSTEIVGEKILSDKILFRHESGFTLELAEGSNKALFKSGLLMLMELSRC